MESAVGLCHLCNDSGHIMEFLLILHLCPLILSVWKKFLIVLYRVIIGIKQILKIVESDDIVFGAFVLSFSAYAKQQERRNNDKYLFHI